VIRVRETPIEAEAGIAVLRGNLAPSGAVIKPAAASAHLLQHAARRWSLIRSRICTHASTIRISTSTRIRSWCYAAAGRGLSGDAGGREHALAHEVARTGRARYGADLRWSHERHRVRTVVLHVAPEAAAQGPLGIVQTGDYIVLDVAGRSLKPGGLRRGAPGALAQPSNDRSICQADPRLGAALRRTRDAGRHGGRS